MPKCHGKIVTINIDTPEIAIVFCLGVGEERGRADHFM
jgi:hypothetical protein